MHGSGALLRFIGPGKCADHAALRALGLGGQFSCFGWTWPGPGAEKERSCPREVGKARAKGTKGAEAAEVLCLFRPPAAGAPSHPGL